MNGHADKEIQRGLEDNPPFLGNFFKFARVFKEKNPKTPLNFPVHANKIQTPHRLIFLDTPMHRLICRRLDKRADKWKI